MPTYVYKGLETGVIFEVEQRITEAPLTHHPETGEPVRRVIQPAGVVFKGSGFYKTDSRASSTKSSSSESKKDSSDSSAAGSDSTSTAVSDSASTANSAAKSGSGSDS